jgi:hypothetical protein
MLYGPGKKIYSWILEDGGHHLPATAFSNPATSEELSSKHISFGVTLSCLTLTLLSPGDSVVWGFFDVLTVFSKLSFLVTRQSEQLTLLSSHPSSMPTVCSGSNSWSRATSNFLYYRFEDREKNSKCIAHTSSTFSIVFTLFLKKCVNLLQEVYYPGSGLLADQGLADKSNPIGGLNSGTTHTHRPPANLHESVLDGDWQMDLLAIVMLRHLFLVVF